MDFELVRDKVKKIKISELRSDEKDNYEAVISKNELGKVNELLTDYFGPALFPSAKELSKQVLGKIDAFGGIQPGQTLFYASQGNTVIFAMLWPWGDGQRITLKLIKI